MKKKVLMAAPYDPKGRYVGGISYVANEIAAATKFLSENEIELIKFETCRRDRQNAEPSKPSFANLQNSLQIYLALPRECKTSSADVLYYHSSTGYSLLKDVFAIRHAKKATGIKTVLHIHFAEYAKIVTGNKMVDHLLQKWIQKYIDHIVFLSKATMEEFIAHGVDKSKCSVVYNFCSLNISENCMKQKLAKSKGTTKFLFVGTIGPRKGLFDALACLRKMDESFELHVCGTPIDDSCEALFNRYREALGEKLVYHGYLRGKDKDDVYYNSDVLLLPSYGEGLPIVILEAYAAGCAVISTTVGGIPELVDENNGTLIRPGDKERLNLALLSYIKMDSDMLKKMQMYNYVVGKNYTVEAFIKNISTICDKII